MLQVPLLPLDANRGLQQEHPRMEINELLDAVGAPQIASLGHSPWDGVGAAAQRKGVEARGSGDHGDGMPPVFASLTSRRQGDRVLSLSFHTAVLGQVRSLQYSSWS